MPVFPDTRRIQTVLVLTLGLFLTTACTQKNQTDHRATPEIAGLRIEKPAKTSHNAMIAVANPLAAQAGYRILRAGGNALDSAIAAQLVLNLVEPQSSGIGGGGFMLLFDPQSSTLTSFDGRESAPENVTPKLFLKEDGQKMGFFEAAVGGRSVGVPGLLHMLQKAHRKYGRMDWELLFDDAIALAEKGFEVLPRLHSLLVNDKHLKDDPVARRYFYGPDGAAHPIGYLLKNPEFAKTLRQIRQGGAESFYIGQIADLIVQKVTKHPKNPGKMSQDDLLLYRSIERKPVCLTYRDAFDVCSMAPPSSGGQAVLETLGLIDQYDLAHATNNRIDRTHLYLEASKLAFADRNQYVADPDFVDVPLDGLLSDTYLKERQQLIHPTKTLPTPVAAGIPQGFKQARGIDSGEFGLSTTHISIVDGEGMTLSMTTSIENAFGSRQMVGGFLLNNQLTDFSFEPVKDGLTVANRVEGAKRPRSSMAPTIVLDHKTGKPLIAIGSPGGSRIIGYVTRSLIGLLDEGLKLDQALARGHATNRNGPSELEKDSALAKQTGPLEKLGQEIRLKEMTSGLHVIRILPDGKREGAADPRREGIVLGY